MGHTVSPLLGWHRHANSAVIRLKRPGEKPTPQDTGSIDLVFDFAEPFTETGATGGETPIHDIRLLAVLRPYGFHKLAGSAVVASPVIG